MLWWLSSIGINSLKIGYYFFVYGLYNNWMREKLFAGISKETSWTCLIINNGWAETNVLWLEWWQARAVPPVVVETWTWDRDFLPGRVFKCTSDLGKSIEYQLLWNIRNFELINDDKVMPDLLEIYWILHIIKWRGLNLYFYSQTINKISWWTL